MVNVPKHSLLGITNNNKQVQIIREVGAEIEEEEEEKEAALRYQETPLLISEKDLSEIK